MRSLFRDVRYAFRVLRCERSFTTVAVLVLAVSIGANTAIFSMADAIVFHPFPFRDLHRLVAVWETVPASGTQRYGMSPGTYFDVREQNHVFERTCAYKAWDVTLTTPSYPERVRGFLVSAEFFSLLGVRPQQGREFSAESARGEEREVVVSYGFWREHLGSGAAAGHRILLNGLTYMVVGVMAEDFDYPMSAEVWSPWIITPAIRADRTERDIRMLARLKDGVHLDTARAEVSHTGLRLAREYPLTNAGRGIGVMLLRNTVDEYADRFMAVVTGAVAFLLLLACANVANLQLARGAARRREVALRLALGASRARIARQFVTEGLLLSFAGAALGLPLAWWALALIRSNMPTLVARHLPGLYYSRIDLSMLGYLFAAAVVSGIAFTIPAALQASSERLQEALRNGGGGVSGGARNWTRPAFVISEIGLAVVLLTGAGLMVKGFENLATMKQGFDPEHVLTFNTRYSETKYRTQETVWKSQGEMLRRLRELPGTRSAAFTSELPALADSRAMSIAIEGQPAARPDRPQLAEVRIVSDDYFRTLGIAVEAGRVFSRQDTEGSLPVAVVSRTAQMRFWPGQDAIGRRARLTARNEQAPWVTVIGVAGDVNHFFLDSEVRPTVYIPYAQQAVRSVNVVLQTSAPMARATGQIRGVLQGMDATEPVPGVQRLKRIYTDLTGGVGIIASLMTVLGCIGLVLAAAGIYAVMSYSVATQKREIGIRVALGADSRDVYRLIFGNALRLVLAGLGIGVPAAFALARNARSVLPGVVVIDPLTFAGIIGVLAGTAIATGWIPARRASRVDPLTALRTE